MQRDKRETAAAYHEAGHAVVLLKLGGAVQHLHIRRVNCDQDWEGCVRRVDGDLLPATRIKVALAGPLAECKFWAALAKNPDLSSSFQEMHFCEWPSFVRRVLECANDESSFAPTVDLQLPFSTREGEVRCVGVRATKFEEDVKCAQELAQKHGIVLGSTLCETQRMLEDAPVCVAIGALAGELLKEENEKTSTIGELIVRPEIADSITDFKGQPERKVEISELSGQAVEIIVRPVLDCHS